jgi:hypothetical protein
VLLANAGWLKEPGRAFIELVNALGWLPIGRVVDYGDLAGVTPASFLLRRGSVAELHLHRGERGRVPDRGVLR